MICNYSFASDKNWRNDFLEVYSLVSETRDSFIQEESAIKNSYNEERQNYNYISIAHNRRFTAGARAMLTCSFENTVRRLLHWQIPLKRTKGAS